MSKHIILMLLLFLVGCDPYRPVKEKLPDFEAYGIREICLKNIVYYYQWGGSTQGGPAMSPKISKDHKYINCRE